MESSQKSASHDESAPNTKERSTIAFPYSDLDAAVEVVKGVHNAGGTACDMDQLAAQLNMEAKGGGFRMRVNGAQTFGLVQYERGGRIVLTNLGREVIDPTTERQARVNSFLAVELYSRVFEDFKGGPLPPQAGLERAIVKLGVGQKVADRARQALLRSAKQAGFFEQAADRLVRPSIKTGEEPKDQVNANRNGGNGSAGNGGDGDLHPLIRGLLVTLPKPSDAWGTSDRMNWLTMANSIFNAIYAKPQGDNGNVSISTSDGVEKQQTNQ